MSEFKYVDFIRILLGTVLLITASLTICLGQLPQDFVKFKIAHGLNPITIVESPDGRIFLVEKDGKILIVEDDKIRANPFLVLNVSDHAERGLLGMELHPEFDENGFFYLFYNVPGSNISRLSRFQETEQIRSTEEVLFDITGVGWSHIGGAVHFGPDSKLYVAIGDNYDTENSQELDNPFGKILRLNDDGSIPADNPFYLQNSGISKAIWAYGLRNPFTFAVDDSSGLFLANDVGSAHWEEINIIEKGMNYGWSQYEGFAQEEVSITNYRDPFYAYDHNTGCSIVGGDFYPISDGSFPEAYHGKYFFVDYCGGFIKVLDPGSGNIIETFDDSITRPLSVLFTKSGDLYFLERGEGAGDGSGEDVTSSLDGALWKVLYNPSGFPIISVQPESKLVSLGESIKIQTSAMGKDPISYQWFRDGELMSHETSNSISLENLQLTDSGAVYFCQVSNDVGTIFTDSISVFVTTNTRPEVSITEPNPTTYAGGDIFQLVGTGSDPEDGELPESAFKWWVDFHHETHTHPAMEPVIGKSASFNITTKGEVSGNVWYRIYLQVIDSEGLTNTVYRELLPRKHQILIQSEPPGLQVQMEDNLVLTPYDLTSVEGIIRSFRIKRRQEYADKEFYFSQWSDTENSHVLKFQTPEGDTTVTASFFSYGLYPNPVEDYLQFVYETQESVEIDFIITTMAGTVLLRRRVIYSPEDFIKKIDLQSLSKGTYILTINTPAGKETYSIVKK